MYPDGRGGITRGTCSAWSAEPQEVQTLMREIRLRPRADPAHPAVSRTERSASRSYSQRAMSTDGAPSLRRAPAVSSGESRVCSKGHPNTALAILHCAIGGDAQNRSIHSDAPAGLYRVELPHPTLHGLYGYPDTRDHLLAFMRPFGWSLQMAYDKLTRSCQRSYDRRALSNRYSVLWLRFS